MSVKFQSVLGYMGTPCLNNYKEFSQMLQQENHLNSRGPSWLRLHNKTHSKKSRTVSETLTLGQKCKGHGSTFVLKSLLYSRMYHQPQIMMGLTREQRSLVQWCEVQETGKNCVVDTKRAEDTVKKHLRQVVETGVENRTGKGNSHY